MTHYYQEPKKIYIKDIIQYVKFGNKVQIAKIGEENDDINGYNTNSGYVPVYTYNLQTPAKDVEFWDRFCNFLDDYGDYEIDSMDMKCVDGINILILVVKEYRV